PQGQGTEPFGPLGAKQPQQSVGVSDASASRQIDDIVRRMAGWRGDRMSQLRALIRSADPGVIEEVKWKKPSRPEGVPVWSHDGIVCIGETLKNAVRLTFPKGARLKDPKGLFNARLDSKAVRAIDFHESDAINASALRALIRESARLNRSGHRCRKSSRHLYEPPGTCTARLFSVPHQ